MDVLSVSVKSITMPMKIGLATFTCFNKFETKTDLEKKMANSMNNFSSLQWRNALREWGGGNQAHPDFSWKFPILQYSLEILMEMSIFQKKKKTYV